MKRSVFCSGLGAAMTFLPRIGIRADAESVSVAYAGSLVNFMERSIGPAFSAQGRSFHGEAKGSTALASLIRDGLRTPDLFISADTAAIESLFGDAGHSTARWYATFASTRMQIAYSPKSKFAQQFAEAAGGKQPWYDVLASPNLRIARTDPAQDPKGYRVLLVLQLAEAFYKKPGLSQKLLGDAQNADQILPEEIAVARLETGDLDALWVYSTEASTRGYATIDLPAQIDLGDAALASVYARATVTVGAKTYVGAPIVYALTIPSGAANAAGGEAFASFLVGMQGRALQQKAGLTPIAPVLGGDTSAIPPKLLAALTHDG